MKLTRRQLRRLIKEEMSRALLREEDESDWGPPEAHVPSPSKKNLKVLGKELGDMASKAVHGAISHHASGLTGVGEPQAMQIIYQAASVIRGKSESGKVRKLAFVNFANMVKSAAEKSGAGESYTFGMGGSKYDLSNTFAKMMIDHGLFAKNSSRVDTLKKVLFDARGGYGPDARELFDMSFEQS